jgi:hypothetical protein
MVSIQPTVDQMPRHLTNQNNKRIQKELNKTYIRARSLKKTFAEIALYLQYAACIAHRLHGRSNNQTDVRYMAIKNSTDTG